MRNLIFKTSSRAKRLRLSSYPDGKIILTVPKRRITIPQFFIDKFLKESEAWLKKQFEKRKAWQVKTKNEIILKGGKSDYRKHKEGAREIITARTLELNKAYKFSFSKIAIRNQKTRWGSCSKKKNLNFNYKIIFLPETARDYIIVHELCHLREFNHSKNFWNLVARVIPDHKKIRKELKHYRLSSR